MTSNMENNTGLVAGITINRPHPSRENSKRNDLMPTIEDVDSLHSVTPNLTPATTRNDERETSPFSPFYSHPTTRTSLDAKRSESKQNVQQYDSDVEACLGESKNNKMSSTTTKNSNANCSVWPGQQALLEKRRAEKRNRGCNPMRNLDSKQKLWVKILIGLLLAGLAIGVGVGISKAVGGGVFKNNSTSATISS